MKKKAPVHPGSTKEPMQTGRSQRTRAKLAMATKVTSKEVRKRVALSDMQKTFC